jgi:hypothetical protein
VADGSTRSGCSARFITSVSSDASDRGQRGLYTALYLRRSVAGIPPRPPGFKPWSSHVGSVLDKAALSLVFSEYFGFPCHSFIPLTAPQSSSIILDWCNRPINSRSDSGLGSTPPPQVNKKIKLKIYVLFEDCLCGLVVRAPATDLEVPGSIPGATRISEQQ